MHSCLLSHKHEQFVVKGTFSKLIVFMIKSIFEPNLLQLVIKKKFINSNPFAFLIINVKSSLIFRRNGAQLLEKRTFEKNKDCPLSRFECFEHAKTFFICVKL
jgi:hypothetical protein